MMYLHQTLLPVGLLLFVCFIGRCDCIRQQLLQDAVDAAGGESDLNSIYRVAKTWYDSSDSKRSDAIEVYQHLADVGKHVLSAFELGMHYSSQTGTDQKLMAVKYFSQAGEDGPHHVALYNAGRLSAELKDWPGALVHLRAAATLSRSYPAKYVKDDTTLAAQQAYVVISNQVTREDLTIVEVADIFIFGSLEDLPDEAMTLWRGAVTELVKFNQTFTMTNGKNQNVEAMVGAVSALKQLWEAYGITSSLSPVQTHILLVQMNHLLGRLSSLDDMYVPMAAGYAEALATRSVYCWEYFAVAENDNACFNDAMANAMSYYRRSGDGEAARRTLQIAQQHPHASTQWSRMEQTPRVYHPELTSKTWWDASDFSAARTLSHTYTSYGGVILRELEQVKSLEEAKMRGDHSVSIVIEADGSATYQSDTIAGFQQISTPYSGVRTKQSGGDGAGAGGLAEFGPLFDGTSWDAEKCKIVPTICDALKQDQSLCSRRSGSSDDALERCGDYSVVTILRLKPGTSILPRCGTTNSRLIMHFALQGAQGVEVTVGGKTVKDYGEGDGHAIVFDDSFEHSVYHGGKHDRFVVFAILEHPGVQ